MKKLILINFFIFTFIYANSQQYRTSPDVVKMDYFSNIEPVLNYTINESNNNNYRNKEYLSALMNWIHDLKSKTDDEIFNKAMDKYLVGIKKLLILDLSGMKMSEFKLLEEKIIENIEDYNLRLEENNKNIAEYQEGLEDLKSNFYYNALKRFNNTIENFPDFIGGYLYKGITLYKMNRESEAIHCLDKALEIDNKNENAYLYKGICLFNLGLYDKSITNFNKVIILNPLKEDSYYYRAMAYSNMKDEGNAISDYKKALELNPNNADVYNNLSWIKFEKKDYKGALELIKKAVQIDPNNSNAWESKGEINLNLGKFQECILDCDKSIHLDPTYSNSYLIKGRALFKLGKKKEACASWQKAKELGNIKVNSLPNFSLE